MVTKEVVATYAAVSAEFGKLGGVTVEVQDHVTGAVADGVVGVGRSIIEEPNGGVTVFCVAFDCWEAMLPMPTRMIGSTAIA